ncbi:hypothetical protein PIB30_075881 [Stylosanthes scabra]|uniref:Uncharacterized protein n=1 Tax=Stylosanthes scabra TaxID=79078 RepID=A0ABU6XN27_9FABA|nr:hypothetical protein [Stylosanthes scabra]
MEFRTGRESGRGASVKWHRCRGIGNMHFLSETGNVSFKDVHQGLSKQMMEGTYSPSSTIFTCTRQLRRHFSSLAAREERVLGNPKATRDLPSQALSIPRRSIPTLFLCANQEGSEDAPLNEEDVGNLNHEEVRECLEEVEEKNEDQEVEDVDHEVENKDKEQKGMGIVHSASSIETPSKLPSELQFEWTDGQLKALCGVLDKKKEDSAELGSEFKAYSGYLHKLHNNRSKIGALSSKKHLGPWQSQEKLVDSQRNEWTNQVWDPGKRYKNQHFWRVIACIGAFRDLLNMRWDPIENMKFKHWWGFKDEFKHKPP